MILINYFLNGFIILFNYAYILVHFCYYINSCYLIGFFYDNINYLLVYFLKFNPFSFNY
jgi:hypothetical protein